MEKEVGMGRKAWSMTAFSALRAQGGFLDNNSNRTSPARRASVFSWSLHSSEWSGLSAERSRPVAAGMLPDPCHLTNQAMQGPMDTAIVRLCQPAG